MQKKELCFVVQGYYGYGWEDLSSSGCGIRQTNYVQANKEAVGWLRDYNLNEPYPHRIIKRYEMIEE